MRLQNNTDRTIQISKGVGILPNSEIIIQADAAHLVKRPLVKAYIEDGTLTLLDASAVDGGVEVKAGSEAPEATSKAEEKIKPKPAGSAA
jgi:hypothetical protein